MSPLTIENILTERFRGAQRLVGYVFGEGFVAFYVRSVVVFAFAFCTFWYYYSVCKYLDPHSFKRAPFLAVCLKRYSPFCVFRLNPFPGVSCHCIGREIRFRTFFRPLLKGCFLVVFRTWRGTRSSLEHTIDFFLTRIHLHQMTD